MEQINGFKSNSTFKISWGPGTWHHTGKGNAFVILPGHKRQRTIDLSRAKTNLNIANYHEFKGQRSPWTVAYAYEDIVGEKFHYHPRGILRFDFAGQHGLPAFSYTLPGKIKSEFPRGFLSDTHRVMVNSKARAYQIKNGATMTLSWENKKAVVTLNKIK